MSFSHIRVVRIEEKHTVAHYRVESPDFNNEHKWEGVGELRIFKGHGRYEFITKGPLLEHKVLPPEIYGLDEKERKRLLDTTYKGYGCGAWMMRIHHYASTFLESGNFPEHYPETYFVSTSR